MLQAAAMLVASPAAGATNIKVNDVEGFSAGQTILIDPGGNEETATIAAVGTPGATTTEGATVVGDTVIPVANAFGFRPGQAITIGEGAEQETAVVAESGRRNPRAISIEPSLKLAHAAGTLLAGTGITLKSGLSRAHTSGSEIADSLPTPGAPNKYAK